MLFVISAAFFLIWAASCLLPSCVIEMYQSLGCYLLSFIIIFLCFPLVKRSLRGERVSTHNKAVLITGCDSGFGHELAKRLDSRGFHVFASCLFPDGQGAETLKKSCSGRLQVLGLDVTKDDSVAQAVQFVKENMNATELWAIVNNAGILRGFAVDWSTMKDFQSVFEVNSLGPVRVTKAFLPMLRSSRGRVVTVVSGAGRIPIPYITGYVMSKYAAAAFCDCMRLELEPWGIRVISVEPEAYKTGLTNVELVRQGFEGSMEALDPETKEDYGEDYFRGVEAVIKNCLILSSEKTYQVVDCIDDAVSLKHPENVYKPSRNYVFQILIRIGENLPFPIQQCITRLVEYVLGLPKPKGAKGNY